MQENELRRVLAEHGQEHLLYFYHQLSECKQKALLERAENIDWSLLNQLQNPEDLSGKGEILPLDGLQIDEIEARRAEFFSAGKQAIIEGKVGAVLLAGGQGTRLGADSPKGTFDIGVSKPLYIFEQLLNNLKEVVFACGKAVPLFIMTSEKNDGATREFFEEHDYFGYPKEEIYFFKQAMAVCVDFNGKILLESRSRIATSPNGNGGWYASLEKAGLEEVLKARGIEWLNVFAVDNVLQKIADPVFIGATVLSGVNCGAKVVSKARPDEKVGVLCLENGVPNVIEYYELTEQMANARNEGGELTYRNGVILNYLFRVETLHRKLKAHIPVHIVKKKIPYIDDAGNKIRPQTENGYKFETLVIDMVKLMETCLPFEVVREKEFAPIKQLTGIDSVESARALLEKNGVTL